MPPLITREEALRLGELEDQVADRGAGRARLGTRAWSASATRPTCARWSTPSPAAAPRTAASAPRASTPRPATPMHAMMEPEQILEHARAAEAAGAHRFCMVTQGQGLSKRDFEKVLERRPAGRRAHQPQALRLDRPHVGRARQGAQGGRASSACTTTSRPPSPTTPRSRPRSATRAGCGRSTRSAKPGWRPASAASSTSARRASSGSRWPSSWPRSTRPASRSTCSTRAPGPSSANAS